MRGAIRGLGAPSLRAGADIARPAGNASDPDDRQSRRATLLYLVGVTGNSPEVQRQARDLALKYIDDPIGCSRHARVNGAERRGRRRRCDALRALLAQLPKLSDKPEEYYRFFNALASFRDPRSCSGTLQFAISPACARRIRRR
jgi:hypothetical protein